MEYVAGQPLRELIHAGLLSVRRAVTLGIQIAEAVQAAHRAGIIHRDVKPENIIVREGDEIKLMDFGIARLRDPQSQPRMTRSGLIVGTLEYIAPEQIEGKEASEQTDIYAWGIVFYEMLSGKVPFTAETPAAMFIKHVQEAPRPVRKLRHEVPAEVERVVMHALAKRPEKRQQHMGEIITELTAAQSKIPAEDESRTIFVRGKWARQRGSRQWRLSLGALVMCAAVVWLVVNQGGVVDTEDKPGPIVEVPVLTTTPFVTPDPEPVEIKSPSITSSETQQAIVDRLQVGKFYLDREQYTEAIAEFEKAKALDAQNAEILQFLTSAREKLNGGKSLSPEVKQTVADHLRVGQFYLDREQYTDAIAEFKKAKALDAQNAEVRQLLASTQKKLDVEKKIRRSR
jgi:serine/threonine protein kinase